MTRLLCPPRELRSFGIFFLLSAAAWGQPAQPSQTELIQRLLQRIDQLEKRVTELEGARTPKPTETTAPTPAPGAMQPSTAAAPGAMATMAGDHDHGTILDPAATYPSLKLSGFSDINFTGSSRPGTHSGFNEGQFILHMSSALSSRVTYFGEISMTARTDAGAGSPPATGFNVEVERSIIRYDLNDHFKLSFGRYHTPVSYWNTQFHHGSWLQTTASRPEMIQFGGNLIPVHFIGALAEGAYSAGGLNINYNAGVGNGRSSVLSRSGDFGDVNNNKAWLATVFIRPDALYGLQAGGSIYRDKIDVTGLPETREWIRSAHLVWTKENPEFIAEYFNISHQRPGSSFVSSSQAWYAQLGYRLPMADHWKPYYRYEYIHVPHTDPVFNYNLLDLAGSTFGLRYDISSFAAFKFEWRHQDRPGLAAINLAWVQTSFTF